MDKAEEAGALEAARTATVKRKPVATTTAPTSYSKPIYRRTLLDRWRAFSRRTKIIILSALLALLILLIGLAAGLSTHHSSQNLPLPGGNGGPFTGDLTYYAPGLGACGVTSTDSDKIVAISHIVFDAASTGSDPNANPLCGKKIRARRNDKSVDLTVVDRCTGCQPKDIDVTIDTFGDLADVAQGRVLVEWNWLD
jgi:hypothetical protein